MHTTFLSFLVAAIVIFSASCERQKKATVDPAPFTAAITDHLSANSMGMKVHEFKTLSVEGQTAKATVSLGHAEEATAIKVRWEFEFARKGDRWIVTKCIR